MIALLAAACALTAAGPAEADVGPVAKVLMQHMAKGLASTKTGEWVTYHLNGGGGREAYWRLSVVGEEKDKFGRDAFWLEMDIGEHHAMLAPLSQLRLLVTKDFAERQDGLTRAYFAWGVQKTQEVDLTTLGTKHKHGTGAGRHDAPIDPDKIHVVAGTEGVLMTEAGSVSAVPVELRYKSTLVRRFWVSNQVPLLHLARIDIPGLDQTLELRDYGANAKPMMLMPDPNEPKIRVEPGGTGAVTP